MCTVLSEKMLKYSQSRQSCVQNHLFPKRTCIRWKKLYLVYTTTLALLFYIFGNYFLSVMTKLQVLQRDTQKTNTNDAIPHFNLALQNNNPTPGILTMLRVIRPKWKETDINIERTPFKSGRSQMFKVTESHTGDEDGIVFKLARTNDTGKYTAGYFRPFLHNKPAFHNLSIIYRINPLAYNL